MSPRQVREVSVRLNRLVVKTKEIRIILDKIKTLEPYIL